MKNEIFLSIVIPVYNAQMYIKKCLDSMVSYIEEFKVQIIAVDDGSVDNSPKILEEYKKKYGITVVTQARIPSINQFGCPTIKNKILYSNN